MQLQQKQERLELALQASSIGVWELNNQTGELIWDERMLNIYGVYPPLVCQPAVHMIQINDIDYQYRCRSTFDTLTNK